MIQVIDHYENPRNVGSMDKDDANVGTGLVGAPACGDVMKLQVNGSVSWLYLTSRDYFVTIMSLWLYYSRLFVEKIKSTAIIVSTIGQCNKKLNFCDIQTVAFLYVIMNMLGGCLPETQNKGIYFISGLKSCRSHLRN